MILVKRLTRHANSIEILRLSRMVIHQPNETLVSLHLDNNVLHYFSYTTTTTTTQHHTGESIHSLEVYKHRNIYLREYDLVR